MSSPKIKRSRLLVLSRRSLQNDFFFIKIIIIIIIIIVIIMVFFNSTHAFTHTNLSSHNIHVNVRRLERVFLVAIVFVKR